MHSRRPSSAWPCASDVCSAMRKLPYSAMPRRNTSRRTGQGGSPRLNILPTVSSTSARMQSRCRSASASFSPAASSRSAAYSLIVSSSRYLASPAASPSSTTSDLSISEMSSPSTASAPMASSEHTCSAMSRFQPEKVASRRSSICSASSSSSIAPVHGGPQRLLPQRRGPVARVQQLEPVPQPVGDLLHRQRPHPGRGQLDAQRDAVQRPAQPGHRRRVVAGQREPGPGPRGPGREQPDRLVRRQLGAAGAVRRQVQRRHPPHRLAPHPQRLPAGRDDPQPRAPGQQQLHQRGAVADLVLAGVQDQQHVPRAQRLGQRLRQRDALLLADPQRGGHRLRDRAVPVGQLDQPRLVQVARPLVRVRSPPESTSRASRTASRVLPIPPGPLRVSARTSPSSLASSARSRSRPMKLFGSAGRLPVSIAVADCMGPLEVSRLNSGTTRVSHRIRSHAA